MMRYECRDYETGNRRLHEDDVKKYPLEHRGAELLFVPNKTGNKSKFIIYVPGGGYLKCWPDEVAATCAAEANDLGYTAFILKYRVIFPREKYAPINDLADAIKLITNNAESFNVDAKNYLLVGFSAGGNIAGLFASKNLGYRKYGLPIPGALGLAYPWTNQPAEVNEGSWLHRTGIKIGQKLAWNLLLGTGHDKKERESLCVHNHIGPDYPPCYIVHGDSDDIVPHYLNSELMIRTLSLNGVKNKYKIAEGMSHGFGIGRDSTADGWHTECIEFWKKNI